MTLLHGSWRLVVGCLVAGCAAEGGEATEQTRSRATLDPHGLRYEAREVPRGLGRYPYFVVHGVAANGDLLGTGEICENGNCTKDVVRLARDQSFTVLARDFYISALNRHGDAAGCTISPDGSVGGQAAILHEDGTLETLPKLPGEEWSCAGPISDGGTVLVTSAHTGDDGLEALSYYVVMDGATFPIPHLEYDIFVDINDRGELAGNVGSYGVSWQRAFRYDVRTETRTDLVPVNCDPTTRAVRINQEGAVLGYSFTLDGEEHIGTWDQDAEFTTLLTQGITRFAGRSLDLVWTDSGLLLMSFTTDDHAYFITEPGVLLDLDSLMVSCSTARGIDAFHMNEHGDFAAFDIHTGAYRWFLRVD